LLDSDDTFSYTKRIFIVRILFLLFIFVLLLPPSTKAQETVPPRYAVSLHGTPKYAEDFKHLSYVNPDAPKGGTLKQHVIGTFDSLNPFIVKGTPAAGLNYMRSGLVYESLMQNAWDEPFTLYGVLAETVEIPDDRSAVVFNLRPEAKFADGHPVTAEDVVWTFNILRDEGAPFFKAYWGDVKAVTAENDRRVKFEFAVKGNAELPLIIAEMAVLPKHFWDGKTFNESSLEKLLGSGPYIGDPIDPGRSITYKRNANWWGKDLPFFKGMYNFDQLEFDYYRDTNVAHEAFFAGEYDVKLENTAKTWAQSYDAPPIKDGRIIKAEIDNQRPAGMQGFVYNIRRPVFADIRVREALAYAFDFEWSNKQFAFGTYTRTDSYFENSELASSGAYTPPVTDGSGNARQNLRMAVKLLDEAGYKMGKDGVRVNDKGVRLAFEILDGSPVFERWVLPFIKNLERIGVKATFRTVDSAQYQNRMNDFDFDMTIASFGQSNSPGNEQRDFWGADKADIPGSRNIIGIKSRVIDDLVTQLIHAESREDLVKKTRALDRELLKGHYVIPMWHYPKWRIAYWSKLKHPKHLSPISPLITNSWWAE
jgi:microcin C transport system substrate-binding protein